MIDKSIQVIIALFLLIIAAPLGRFIFDVSERYKRWYWDVDKKNKRDGYIGWDYERF